MNSSINTFATNEHKYLVSLEQKKIASKTYLYTQINFKVTDRNLSEIKTKNKQIDRLILSPELLANLRHYSLFPFCNYEEPQLIFTTYYIKEQQKTAVIKTTISLKGKIFQQISRRFLDEPQLLNKLIKSHYKTIDRINDRLLMRYQNKLPWLIWGLSSIILLLIAPFLFYFANISGLFKLTILFVLFILIKIAIQFITKKYLPSFLLQQLLFGFFSAKTSRKRLGFMLLRYLS